jgi:ribosomal protein S18 acetylase RimI-like enzyme
VTFTIRPATPADATAISTIHLNARQQAYAEIMPPQALSAMAEGASPSAWAERLRHSTGRGLVAVDDGTGSAIGFVYVTPSGEGIPGTGDLVALHVDPAHQGAGAGGQLLEAGLDILARKGFSTYVLWVLEGNERAIRFYRKRGWVPDGHRFRDAGGVFLRFVLSRAWRDQTEGRQGQR